MKYSKAFLGSFYYLCFLSNVWLYPNGNKKKSNDTIKYLETTTAEPKNGFSSTTISNAEIFNSTLRKKLETTTTIKSTTTFGNELSKKYVSNSFYTTTTSSNLLSPPLSSFASSSLNIHHEFDFLSFIGGSLFTFCLVILIVMVWKMYKLYVERNYRTI